MFDGGGGGGGDGGFRCFYQTKCRRYGDGVEPPESEATSTEEIGSLYIVWRRGLYEGCRGGSYNARRRRCPGLVSSEAAGLRAWRDAVARATGTSCSVAGLVLACCLLVVLSPVSKD